VWAYCVILGIPPQPATGSGTLATIKFRGSNGGSSHMTLAYPGFTYPVKLSDVNSTPISCTATDARVQVIDPSVWLNPVISREVVGNNILVDVIVSNVVNLHGWEFKLFYETNYLDAVDVTEGSFLDSFAGASGTYFAVMQINDAYNSTHGLVWAYCVILGIPPQPATGSGTLATIKFRGSNGGVAHMALTYPGFAYPIKLSDANSTPIPCKTTTGSDALIVGPATVPLDINIDVGAMYFAGEQVEFYIMTTYHGVPVTPTYITAVLHNPAGGSVSLTPQALSTGFYKATYTMPSDASAGTWAIVVEATYFTDALQAHGTSFKTYQFSSMLNALITDISDLQMRVTAIEGSTATIQTTLGTMQGTITSINNNIATIQTDIGTVKLDISTVKANTTPTTDWTTIGLYMSLALLMSIVVVLVVLYIYLRARFRSEAVSS
jgi:hypothetical protein